MRIALRCWLSCAVSSIDASSSSSERRSAVGLGRPDAGEATAHSRPGVFLAAQHFFPRTGEPARPAPQPRLRRPRWQPLASVPDSARGVPVVWCSSSAAGRAVPVRSLVVSGAGCVVLFVSSWSRGRVPGELAVRSSGLAAVSLVWFAGLKTRPQGSGTGFFFPADQPIQLRSGAAKPFPFPRPSQSPVTGSSASHPSGCSRRDKAGSILSPFSSVAGSAPGSRRGEGRLSDPRAAPNLSHNRA